MRTDYPRAAAQALIALRGLTTEEVAQRISVPEDMLLLFLDGYEPTLTVASFDALFRELGVEASESGARLGTDRVHYLYANFKRRRDKEAFQRFIRAIGPLVPGLVGMEMESSGGTTTFLLRGPDVRIVLRVKHSTFKKPMLADIGVPPGTFKGFSKVDAVPSYLTQLLRSNALSPNYFDVLLSGAYAAESLELVRLAALERDIPLSKIVEWITSHQRATPGAMGGLLREEGASENMKNVVLLFPSHFDRVVSPSSAPQQPPADAGQQQMNGTTNG